MQIDSNDIELGDVVKDTVTGLTGTAVGVHQYLTGCARISIQPSVGRDGKVPDSYAADAITVKVVERRRQARVDRSVGGPPPGSWAAAEGRR